jgi:anthranilate phosphoribosyltransferase
VNAVAYCVSADALPLLSSTLYRVPNLSQLSAEQAASLLAEVGGFKALLVNITAGRNLNAAQTGAAFSSMLTGGATPAQIAGFLVGMHTKGESVEELSAALATMYDYSVDVPLTSAEREGSLCTCGTGGDQSNSINISTTAAFIVAAAGVPICKHGNRAVTSQAGSADVLEALGVAVDISPEGVAACMRVAGIGFCLAPKFHPNMRFVGPTRKELGVASMFNMLGPIANPGRVHNQVMGVSDVRTAPKVAKLLAARGQNAMVVHGHDGLDELSTTALSTIWRVQNGTVSESVFDPRSVGLSLVSMDDLRGGTATENAAITTGILAGVKGAHRDIVLLNAAASLAITGRAADIAEGMKIGAELIESGAATRSLDLLVSESNRHVNVP